MEGEEDGRLRAAGPADTLISDPASGAESECLLSPLPVWSSAHPGDPVLGTAVNKTDKVTALEMPPF